LYQFFYSKSIIIEDDAIVVSKPAKRPLSITKLEIFSFDIDKQLNQHINILKVFFAEQSQKVYKYIRILSAVLVLFSLSLFFYHHSELKEMILHMDVHLFQIITLYISIFLMTVIHEFGHIIQCKKYTDYVGKCGCMLYFLFPVLYTEVT